MMGMIKHCHIEFISYQLFIFVYACDGNVLRNVFTYCLHVWQCKQEISYKEEINNLSLTEQLIARWCCSCCVQFNSLTTESSMKTTTILEDPI